MTPPVDGALLRAALVASCFLGAFPPVDLRAVCLVRAMTASELFSSPFYRELPSLVGQSTKICSLRCLNQWRGVQAVIRPPPRVLIHARSGERGGGRGRERAERKVKKKNRGMISRYPPRAVLPGNRKMRKFDGRKCASFENSTRARRRDTYAVVPRRRFPSKSEHTQ